MVDVYAQGDSLALANRELAHLSKKVYSSIQSKNQ